MGRTFQSGVISRLVVGGGTYAFLQHETQIDVDNSNGLATIIKLQPIDPSIGNVTVYINDYGKNSSIGNITIVASAGNLINGQSTLVLDTNGIGAEISISDQNNFIASLNNDTQNGGGTITGANNGLSVLGTIIQLGGTLISPTVINALGSNVFSINDQAGLFMQTRDTNGNFFFNNIGGTGTLVGNSYYVFSYLGDGGNVFEDTTIVVNFGGAIHIKGGTDFLNFGDYTIAENCFNVHNFGRQNSYYNSNNGSLIGSYNVTSSVSTFGLLGDSNVISNISDLSLVGSGNSIINGNAISIFGRNNNLTNINNSYVIGENVSFSGYFGYVVGRNVTIDSTNPAGDVYVFGTGLTVNGGKYIDNIVSVGFVNNINATSSTRGVYIFGDSNTCNDFVTYSTLIGESCSMTRADHCFSFGIFNSYSDASFIYSLGEGNSVNNATSSIVLGLYNSVNGVTNSNISGRSNILVNSQNIIELGDYNGVSFSNDVNVFGSRNVLSNVQSAFVVGESNRLQNSSLANFLGIGNNSSVVSGVNLVGGNNTFSNSSLLSILGNSNTIDSINEFIMIGQYNNVSGSAYNRSICVGFSNIGVKINEQTVEFGVFGSTPLMTVNIINNRIEMDLPTTPLGLPVKSLWNNYGVVNIV